MGGIARPCAAISIVIAAALAVLTGTAAAASASCDDKVLSDWSDNGRVDGIYPLQCYEAALDSMPTDLRDYTNAPDAIERALARATTRSAPKTGSADHVAAGSQVAAPAPSNLPLPLVALAAISFSVFGAGGLAYVVRRRRERRQA
jgi:hypothetical protein